MFFTPLRRITVAEIADCTGAILYQKDLASVLVEGVASLYNSCPGTLVFAEGKKEQGLLANLAAAAIFCSEELVNQLPSEVAALVSCNPRKDFATIARMLYPLAIQSTSFLGDIGISYRAYIHPSVNLEEDITIEAGAFIGKNVEIGSGTVVSASVVIAENCKIGRNCYIGPGVSVQYALIGNGVILHAGVRIGQDGFGYVSSNRGVEKIPHIGSVIIQDDVEIGANTTVDRGALHNTIIGEGTKIDNLVQIAHNVRIGRFCLIAAHCGISGSCVIGEETRLGGRVGIADHVIVGSGVQIAAASGVMNDIPDGEKWGGIPARPVRKWLREVAALRGIGNKKGKDEDDTDER
ncbi:MAG: UDP-3-O-[3-hydroxymyristoyl] glucosamine N-acyltransferase [Candidatus Tokpelaia sp. JSC161]|nr:MAG: UDP-3-O-[3-hydroxymyristoyl] glucosamine N-acyltransferase [Candidatus Tokpelaia sp. JSC161]